MSSYKVLSFNENEGQLIIEFAEGYAPLSIDIPIENGLYITGETLDNYIKGFIPTWHLERQEQIKAGIPNADELKSLVENEPIQIQELTENEQKNLEMWSELQFEKNIAKVLVKFGVIESDPTTIPTAAM